MNTTSMPIGRGLIVQDHLQPIAGTGPKLFETTTLSRGEAIYSRWIARGGDNLILTADLVSRDNGTLKVTVFHKSRGEAGDGSNADGGAGTDISLSAVGRESEEWMGVKELVRYRVECTGASASDSVTFRLLAPTWFNTVNAV